MTIMEAVVALQELKPHQYDEATIVRWLSNLDGLLYNEAVKWHEGTEGLPHGPYGPESDMDAVLMVPEPYSDVYIQYLSAQIEYHNGETGRYQNAMVMYNMALSAAQDYLNRTRMPRQDNYIII
jgi:hypothetical protein